MIPESEIIKLIEGNKLIAKDILLSAKKRATHLGCSIVDILIGQNLLTENKLGELMAKYYGVNYVNLINKDISLNELALIPELLAAERGSIVFKKERQEVHLAMENPDDLGLIELIRKTIGPGTKIIPYLTTKNSIHDALRLYNQLREKKQDAVSGMTVRPNQSAISIIDELLEDALREKASDIHIEATPTEVLARLRIDGVLHDQLFLPKSMHSSLVARIKVMSDLKLDEHRLPQDGNFAFKTKRGDKISLRVSIIPTVQGEKVVLRILEDALTKFDLSELGLIDKQQELIEKILTKSHGMILLTGPTGSGKTTSLYTMLGLLNKSGVNIITVEDPVENRMRRVNQIQTNSYIGLTFAGGLRSILRQDPDIIMVGEIRDNETAVIAVNAAMTGHIVLSSVHANNSTSSIPRMIDLGVEPFLLASTLNMVIAQRLVRILCPKCFYEIPLSPFIKKRLNDASEIAFGLIRKKIKCNYAAKGCPECNFSGYRGRTGVFEILVITDEIKELIVSKATSQEIWKEARQNGLTTMLEDGLLKVAARITSLDEVFRVISD